MQDRLLCMIDFYKTERMIVFILFLYYYYFIPTQSQFVMKIF